MITIQENAIFIADAHHHSLYQNTLDSIFKELLESQRRQIFLMGDIFDFLVGYVEQSLKDNQKTLELLEQLSFKHEIYYFEGNHDFLLSTIPYFKNIHCIPLELQPLCCQFNEKEAYLAHGDIFLSWYYKLFTILLRQKFLIKFLNIFSFFLYPRILQYLQNKNQLKNRSKYARKYHTNDDKMVLSRIENYIKNLTMPSDSYVIEGHFHWGINARFHCMNYIGLPFFACKKNYFVVEYANYCLSLIEKEF